MSFIVVVGLSITSLVKGHLNLVVILENVGAVQHMINKNCHMTYCEIETSLSISLTRIH